MQRIAAVLALWAAQAGAQDLPALYDVTGVAANDVLNVRTRPMGSSAIIGTLAPGARDIEVIEEDNGWGRVNVDGMSGWASLRYLNQQVESQIATAYSFRCFGTEPFWSMQVTPGQTAVISSPDGPDKAFGLGVMTTASARRQPHALLGSAQGENLTLVVSERMCSDGMSDNLYGLEGTVVIGGYDMRVFSGCCSLEVD